MGLILSGETEDHPGEALQLALAAPAAGDLPDTLPAPTVERLGPHRYRIASNSREWVIDGRAHLHRDVGNLLRAALPDRAVSWRKRIFWRVLLALAANRLTRRLLLRSRS